MIIPSTIKKLDVPSNVNLYGQKPDGVFSSNIAASLTVPCVPYSPVSDSVLITNEVSSEITCFQRCLLILVLNTIFYHLYLQVSFIPSVFFPFLKS
ncbi:rCG63549 [Rattus norvegicus]|uniref:RCG63549 n=1 Tax=Rattus norvegicus TaxID=10116 RepID=A6JBW4_RAT|nr:rCG63549 [Rattus norvegicus]